MDEPGLLYALVSGAFFPLRLVSNLVGSGYAILMNTIARKTVRPEKREVPFSAYIQMMKPTISLLVVFTTLPTLFMASPQLPSLGLFLVVLIGTFLASSSSAIFNHVLDSDIDATMTRTSRRPLPSGKVNSDWAVMLAVTLGAVSFLILALFANPLTAWVALLANFFYVFIYTLWLKRRTPQNIVIGGAAGSVGPLIGWAAVTGTLSWESWVLFLIIFLWTPPHFWALAIKYREDYSKAKVPMLPCVSGIDTTRRQMFYYTLLLIPVSISLYTHGDAGLTYLIVALASSLYFCFLTIRLMVTKKDQHVMPVFFFSLFYIFAIFGALAVEQFLYRI